MPRRIVLLALLGFAFALGAGAGAQPPGAEEQLPESAQEVTADELENFVAIFIDLRENAAGFPGMTPPEERRESIEIIEEHGWTLWRYNRFAHLINSTPELFQQFSRILEEQS